MVGIEPTLLSEPDFEGRRAYCDAWIDYILGFGKRVSPDAYAPI